MAIRLGTGADFAAGKIKLGTTSITKVYLGTVQIWPVATTGTWYRIGSMWYQVGGTSYTPSYNFSDSRNSQYLSGGGV